MNSGIAAKEEEKSKEAGTSTEDIIFTNAEKDTIRQHLSTAKRAIASVKALLCQKQSELTTRIGAVSKDNFELMYFPAHPVMGDGGRVFLSSNHSSELPANNLNHFAQELGLGLGYVEQHSDPARRRLNILKQDLDSIADLMKRSDTIN